MQKVLMDYLQRILTARVYDVAVESAPGPGGQALEPLGQPGVAQARRHPAGLQLQAARGLQQDGPALAEQLERGVICASAGNHAQGVALSARRLGCRAVIVMPVTTPKLKLDAVRTLGGEVVLHGDSYSDAYLARRRSWRSRHQICVRASVR